MVSDGETPDSEQKTNFKFKILKVWLLSSRGFPLASQV